MPNYYDRAITGLLGPTSSYDGLLDPQVQQQARQQAQMALAAQLLSAGGYSDRPTTFGQAFGGAIQAGQQTQNASLNSALQAQLMKSQMIRNARENVPTSQREYEYAKANGYTGSFDEWKQITQQEAKPTSSIQEYNLYSQQEIAAGRTPMEYDKWLPRRAAMNVGAPYQLGEMEGGKVVFNKKTGQWERATTASQEAAAAGEIAGGETGGKAQATRVQAQIDTGLDAADALATVKRGRQLLETIETGGLDRAALAITQAFGVTGADEAELSANLGKAVLSQLRATFGAQFTEKEGERLASIEAGFGKSTEGNKRLLQQAEAILDRAARRGLKAAEDSGDTFTAEEIRKSMNFSLDPAAPKAPQIPPAVRPTSTRKPDKPKETAAERAKRLGL
jgi:hypothetical protein